MSEPTGFDIILTTQSVSRIANEGDFTHAQSAHSKILLKLGLLRNSFATVSTFLVYYGVLSILCARIISTLFLVLIMDTFFFNQYT